MTEFKPNYTITNTIASNLLKIERIKENIKDLPITPAVMASLRESARLTSVHYSTQIEGNRLSQEEVIEVIQHHAKIPQRVRDEKEVLGYYKAIEYMEQQALLQSLITEKQVQTIHALVEAGGSPKVKPTPYREGQNVIRDSASGGIVYMPPEAKDVQDLMRSFISWLNQTANEIPAPIRAAIAHYQFATIHPYYDGNGRTARLLTTLVLYKGGYDLKGIYSLEEYYAKDLHSYYAAISVGNSHNYYMGRAEADITKWVEYFIAGMAAAFENVQKHAALQKTEDISPILKTLDPKQRQALILFKQQEIVTTNDIAAFFGCNQRTARELAAKWTKENFLIPANTSKRGRKYKINDRFIK